LDIVIHQLPDVEISSPALQYCTQDNPVNITGNPAGGTLTGAGISNGVFNPQIAGEGEHAIVYTYTDANLCSNSASVTIDVENCLDLETLHHFAGIVVQPNPFKNQLNFAVDKITDEKLTISITDVTGKECFRQVLENKAAGFQIQLPDGASGVYVLKIHTASGKQFFSKLIRE
jgi:hypothetical protein